MGKEPAGGNFSTPGTLRFGPFQFDVRAGELTKHGLRIRLQEQPFQILRMLLMRPGEIVLREEIRQNLWPDDTVVEFDHSINAAIKRLRDALGESAESPRYVETVARRGYRFIGKLEGILAPQPTLIRAELMEDTTAGPTLPIGEPKRKLIPQRIGIVAMAIAIVALASLLSISLSRKPLVEVPRLRFSIPAPEGTAFTNLYGGATISPDGRFLAFTALRSRALSSTLWLRAADSMDARELPGSDGAVTAFWSPDSKWIAFFANGKIKKIPVSGGSAQVLCDAFVLTDWDSGTWSSEGIIVFSSRGVLHRISADGGLPTVLTKPNAWRQEIGYLAPRFLSAGRRLFYFIDSTDPNTEGLYGTSVDRPEERIRIVGSRSQGEYVPPRPGRSAYLLWVREKTLVAQPFSAERVQLSGSQLPITEDIAVSAAGTGAFWVSNTGLLVYRSGSSEKTRMQWISRAGSALDTIDKDGVYGVPRISPDGRRVAIRNRTDSGNTDVWIYEFSSARMTRQTFDPGAETFPVWSPDGRQLAFSCGGICRGNADGTGPAERLAPEGLTKRLLDWSSDGSYLLYTETHPQTLGDLWVLPLRDGRKPTPFLRTPFNEFYGQFSPDSKWIAYTSDESGREEIYIRSFPDSGSKRQVSNSGGVQPRWRRDGKELFYLAGGNMMAASIRVNAGSLESGPPHVLFPFTNIGGTFYSYDVAPDGNRFLVLQPVGGNSAGALTVLSGW
jgi:eukaryotic-like serine/threonine-protein kinase